MSLLIAGLVLSGCVSTSTAATIDGTVLTSKSLLSEVKAITSNKAFISQLQSSQQITGQGSDTYNMTFVDEVLNRRISMDLISQEAQKLNVKLTAQDIALGRIDAEQTYGGASVFSQFPKSYQAELIKDSATLDAVEARLIHADISLGALRNYYNSNPGQFASVCSSQILVGTQAQANSIYQQLQHGANFAALAKADSGDPNTASNGGAVGCGTYANYLSALGNSFAKVVEGLSPNAFAPPVHLSSGWSIIEVTSRSSLPFDQLTPQIRAAILGSKGPAAITNLLNKVASTASIKVDPRYGQISRSSSGIGVAPLPVPSTSTLNFFVPTLK